MVSGAPYKPLRVLVILILERLPLSVLLLVLLLVNFSTSGCGGEPGEGDANLFSLWGVIF